MTFPLKIFLKNFVLKNLCVPPCYKGLILTQKHKQIIWFISLTTKTHIKVKILLIQKLHQMVTNFC